MRSIIVGVVTAIAYVAMEAGLHGGLLADIYQQTASVWRPQEEMKSLWPFLMLGQAIFGFFFGFIYTKGFSVNRGFFTQGFRYGLMMAFLLGPVSGLVWYAVLPIPQTLALSWALGAAVQCQVLGMIAGLIYRP